VIVLVTGGRKYRDKARLYRVMDSVLASLVRGEVLYVVHGNAPGADSLAADWIYDAQKAGHAVFEIRCPAPWDGPHKRGAGFARNFVQAQLVSSFPEKRRGAIAFPGGNGTLNQITACEALGIPVMKVDW